MTEATEPQPLEIDEDGNVSGYIARRRFALVGPVENGADRFLIVDLQSPHADAPVMGEPVALIEDGGVYASLIVDVLNAHADEYSARLDAVLASQPFCLDAGEWTPGWFGGYPGRLLP